MKSKLRFLIPLATATAATSAHAQFQNTITFTRVTPVMVVENEPLSSTYGGFASTITTGLQPVAVGTISTGSGAYSTWWSEWGDEPFDWRGDYGYNAAQAGASYSASLDAIYDSSVNRILVTIPIIRTRAASSWASIWGDEAVLSEAVGNAMHDGGSWAGCRSLVSVSGTQMTKVIPEEHYRTTKLQLLFNRVGSTSTWTVHNNVNIGLLTAKVKSYARTVVSNDDWYGGQVSGQASASIADSISIGAITSTIDPGIVYGTPSVPRLVGPITGRPITIRLRAANSNTDLEVIEDAVLLQNGGFWIGKGGLTGSHDVLVSRKGCLRKKVSGLTLATNQITNATFNLILGDVNGDNVINSADATAVSNRLGASTADTNWFDAGTDGLSAEDCDVDEDGTVDAEDLDIVQDNLNLVGN